MRYIKYICIAFLLIFSSTLQAQEEDSRDYQYALIEAVKQKNLGNLSEAVKLYRLVIREKPDCDVAYYELGSIYLMTQQNGMALENLEKAYLMQPDNRWYGMAYLNALNFNERFEDMEDLLLAWIKLEPDEVEWQFQLAGVYLSMAKPKKALKTLDRIERDNGFSGKVTLLKASVYEEEGDYDKALAEIERIIAFLPEEVRYRALAADLCKRQGLEERAAGYYLSILEVDSTDIYALTNLTDYYMNKEDYGNSLNYLALSFQSQQIKLERKLGIIGFYLKDEQISEEFSTEIGRVLEVLIDRHPDSQDALLMAADFFIRQQDYAAAYRSMKLFVDLGNANYAAHMQVVLLANAASLDHELLEFSGQAMEQYPDSLDFRFFRGIAFYNLEDYKGLLHNFRDLSMDSFSSAEYASQARMLVAEAAYRLNDFDKADSLFVRIIQEEPDNYMVLNNYAYYLAEREENLEQAENWSRTTVENNPENPTFLDTYAWILFKLGLFEKAETYILKAIKFGGENDPEVNEHAGDIMLSLHQLELARSYFERAIGLGADRVRLEEKIRNSEKDSL